jgi:hypothetical protein
MLNDITLSTPPPPPDVLDEQLKDQALGVERLLCRAGKFGDGIDELLSSDVG